MNAELVIIAVIVGVGTWAMRFFPTKLKLGSGDPDRPVSRFLTATGPSAITALFVAAVLPMFQADAVGLAPVICGAFTVAGVYAWRRDVSLATVAGATVFGIVFAFF